MQLADVRSVTNRIVQNVDQVLVGKHGQVEMIMVSLLCRGHVLIEDVPGVGKTILARAIATSIGASFKRIQFTPDLLPTDITGVNIFDPRQGTFAFRPGPVISQMVLADEINRATPKTQSALLEAMEESSVTVDGETHRLPEPFIVLATANPIDYEGTFPLPEAQLDRFLLRIALGYPGTDNEKEMLVRQNLTHPIYNLRQVITASELVDAQRAIAAVHVSPLIADYIVSIVEATRAHADVLLGASPRGSLALYNAARAMAAITGREFVTPDDVKRLVEPTLSHRLILNPATRVRGIGPASILRGIVNGIQVPGSSPRAAAAS